MLALARGRLQPEHATRAEGCTVGHHRRSWLAEDTAAQGPRHPPASARPRRRSAADPACADLRSQKHMIPWQTCSYPGLSLLLEISRLIVPLARPQSLDIIVRHTVADSSPAPPTSRLLPLRSAPLLIQRVDPIPFEPIPRPPDRSVTTGRQVRERPVARVGGWAGAAPRNNGVPSPESRRLRFAWES